MTEEQAVIRAALRLADAVLDSLESDATELLERTTKDYAGADYYYDTATFKRWITDGNPCDLCEENESAGWIDIDDVWPNADDVPAHPNCMCTTEEKERRYRVYV